MIPDRLLTIPNSTMAFVTPRNNIDSSSCIAKSKALKNTMWKQQNI